MHVNKSITLDIDLLNQVQQFLTDAIIEDHQDLNLSSCIELLLRHGLIRQIELKQARQNQLDRAEAAAQTKDLIF
jgi:hypothetical protein